MVTDQGNWLETHPEISALRVAVCDLNGVARGKRVPVASRAKLLSDGARTPLSAIGVDIWGKDIADNPLVFETGDADGILRVTERGVVPMPWLNSALLPVWIFFEDGTPYQGDPRRALQNVLDEYTALGWTPVAATEMEFHLVDAEGGRPKPYEANANDLLSVGVLDAFDEYFNELYAACEKMGIAADAASSEAGLGQFEINLSHGDAMKAADDAWLFKQAAKGIARKHGFAATFMAKPFAKDAGNGLHVHFSLLDQDGTNIFDDGTENGTELMLHAVGGLINAMEASTLIFAPHKNSYRRMEAGNHAPTAVAWGYENRTAAIRIPGGPTQARRIEHRVAGGDANPYLLLASILGSALEGIKAKTQPPEPIVGNVYEQDLPQLPDLWRDAIDLFAQSPEVAAVFDPEIIRALVTCKQQELARFEAHWTDFEFSTYLDTV